MTTKSATGCWLLTEPILEYENCSKRLTIGRQVLLYKTMILPVFTYSFEICVFSQKNWELLAALERRIHQKIVDSYMTMDYSLAYVTKKWDLLVVYKIRFKKVRWQWSCSGKHLTSFVSDMKGSNGECEDRLMRNSASNLSLNIGFNRSWASCQWVVISEVTLLLKKNAIKLDWRVA